MKSAIMKGLILACLLLAGILQKQAAAQTPIHTVDTDGVEQGTWGSIAGVVGDIDQDGIQDYAVRSYTTFPVAGNGLRVFSGATGTLLHARPLDISIFVESVQPAGDLNGDGIDDILIGYPTYFTSGQGFLGRVFVLSGADLSVLHMMEGMSPNEQLGTALCMIGDLDQDGTPDIAASGLFFPLGNLGRFIRFFSGATGTRIGQWTSANDFSWAEVMAPLGDIDNDGTPDLVVGSDSFPAYGHQSDGAAWALSGATGAVLYQVAGNQPQAGMGGTRFATDLDTIGDVDGDGITDFVVTAVNDNVQGPGTLWVFSGASGSLIHLIHGENVVIGPNGPLAMWFVSAAGDIDGDGVPDFLAGHPGGTSALEFTPGIVRVYSGLDGSKLMQLDGRLEGDELFGYSFSALDDVNGDGHDDFVVGIRGRVTGAFSQLFPTSALNGAVVVYSGTCLPPAAYCPGTPNSTGTPAILDSQGSLSLAANNLVLTISGGVPNQFGLFFYGGASVDLPFGNGRLCVGGGSQGLFRLNPPTQVGAGGTTSLAIDLTQPPMASGSGEVIATSTWNFQFWYRDPAAGGSAFNLSNAVEAYFCP